jgi:hypothetical protein
VFRPRRNAEVPILPRQLDDFAKIEFRVLGKPGEQECLRVKIPGDGEYRQPPEPARRGSSEEGLPRQDFTLGKTLLGIAPQGGELLLRQRTVVRFIGRQDLLGEL